jgi:hypothetical protein
MSVSELWARSEPEVRKPVKAVADPVEKAKLIREFQERLGLPVDNKKFNEWLTLCVGSQQIQKGIADG